MTLDARRPKPAQGAIATAGVVTTIALITVALSIRQQWTLRRDSGKTALGKNTAWYSGYAEGIRFAMEELDQSLAVTNHEPAIEEWRAFLYPAWCHHRGRDGQRCHRRTDRTAYVPHPQSRTENPHDLLPGPCPREIRGALGR